MGNRQTKNILRKPNGRWADRGLRLSTLLISTYALYTPSLFTVVLPDQGITVHQSTLPYSSLLSLEGGSLALLSLLRLAINISSLISGAVVPRGVLLIVVGDPAGGDRTGGSDDGLNRTGGRGVVSSAVLSKSSSSIATMCPVSFSMASAEWVVELDPKGFSENGERELG